MSGQVEQTGIRDAVFMELSVIAAKGGHVLHMLKKGNELWPDFPEGLGEIYFSAIEPGVVRAWKLHERQTACFSVPHGQIKIVLYDARADSPTLGVLAVLALGFPANYRLLRIPAGIWYGFQCAGNESALICNCADLPHDPEEMRRLPQDSSEIPYKW